MASSLPTYALIHTLTFYLATLPNAPRARREAELQDGQTDGRMDAFSTGEFVPNYLLLRLMRNDQSHLLKFMVELKEGGMMRLPGTPTFNQDVVLGKKIHLNQGKVGDYRSVNQTIIVHLFKIPVE